MTKLPKPLTPKNCDLRDQPWFALHVGKLARSDWWRRASHVARSINVSFWVAAWHEVPAASLPNDDVILAGLAGFGVVGDGLAEWKKIREEVLAPWIVASDGRLYHKTLAEEAREAHARKTERNKQLAADAERKRLWRAAKAAKRAKTKEKKSGGRASSKRPPDVRSYTDTDTDTDTSIKPPKPPKGGAMKKPTSKKGRAHDDRPGRDGQMSRSVSSADVRDRHRAPGDTEHTRIANGGAFEQYTARYAEGDEPDAADVETSNGNRAS